MKIRLLLACLLCILLWSSLPGAAQDTSSCPALVQAALQNIGQNCDRLGRNNACYGFQNITTTFFETQADSFFASPADRADLPVIQSLATAPLDAVSGEWGIAVLNVQANLPQTLPGQAAVFILMGDVAVENAVEPSSINPVRAALTSITGANIRSAPTVNSNLLGSVPEGALLTADSITADGRWLRVSFNNRIGWIAAELVRSDDDLRALSTTTTRTLSPMQSFRLTTALSGPECEAAPPSLLVLQGPSNLTVDLNINGADISIGSTVALRQPDEGTMQLLVIDGRATLDNQTVRAGYSSTLTLEADENGQPVAGRWQPARPFSRAEFNFLQPLENIPVNLLHYPIIIPSQPIIFSPPPVVIVSTPQTTTTTECSGLRLTSPLDGIGRGLTTFYWDAAPGATSYRLNLYGVDAGKGALVGSYEASGTSITVDTSVVSIGEGFVFAWEVVALIDGQPVCSSGPLDILREAGPDTGGGSLPPTPRACGGIIRLVGSPYTGPFDVEINADNYTGTACDEIIHGNNNANIIFAGAGNDTIFGYGGDDILHGEAGDDIINAGPENDQAFGGTGSDTVEGGPGVDQIFGGWDNRGCENRDDIGNDVVTDSGGDNGDLVLGGNQNFGCGQGNDGDDTVTDTGGDGDALYGGNGSGGGATFGNDGNDVVSDLGGDNDFVFGGNGNGNPLSGGNDGSDVITAIGNNDVVAGGNNVQGGGFGLDNVDGGGDVINTADGDNNDLVFGGNWAGAGIPDPNDPATDTCNTDVPAEAAAALNCP